MITHSQSHYPVLSGTYNENGVTSATILSVLFCNTNTAKKKEQLTYNYTSMWAMAAKVRFW